MGGDNDWAHWHSVPPLDKRVDVVAGNVGLAYRPAAQVHHLQCNFACATR
jgi:hypothetical protein